MFRKYGFLIMLVAMLAFGLPAHASKVGMFGAPNSSGTGPLEVNSDRVLTIATDAGLLMSYESATTTDTLTSVDCGKTFLVAPASQMTFTLPSAASVAGCQYNFIATNGAATKKIIIDVGSTDMFRGVINSAADTTFLAGDSVISPGNTNDSISVISGGTTVWDVVYERGTFVDNN